MSTEKVTALATRPRAGALVQDRITWTDDQIALIQRTVAQGTSPDEFKLFLYQSARTGLDPLAKQIYAVRRAGRMTIQTGIDGYRLVADRTRKYAGSDDATFAGKVGTPDFAATVTVYKIVQGVRCPFTATARWSEYFPGEQQGTMWRKMPHTMLAKCAEACALRKAFPADLSGIYTAEEMDQAGATGPVVEAEVVGGGAPPPAGPPPAAEPERQDSGTTTTKARSRRRAPDPAPEPPAAPAPAAPPEGETIEAKAARIGIAQGFAREKYKDFDAKIGAPHLGLIFGTAKQHGYTKSGELHPITERLFGVSSVKDVPLSGLDDLIRALTGEPEPGQGA